MDDRPIEPNDPQPHQPDEPTGPEPGTPAPISPEVPTETEAPRAEDLPDLEYDSQVQDDEGDQAQTLADEVRYGGVEHDPTIDSERVRGGLDDDGDSAPDLVDTMKQMVRSGHIDMDAYLGERNDDDEDYTLGVGGEEEDGPRGAE